VVGNGEREWFPSRQTSQKIMKHIIIQVLNFMFPFKEIDSQPDYTFTDESFIAGMFRRNQILDWKAK
jgi:hypothetical protein